MAFQTQSVAYVVLALLAALVVSFLMTPVVKSFAYKVGAIDVPKDDRRMHKKPIPRLGGLAIFFGKRFKSSWARPSRQATVRPPHSRTSLQMAASTTGTASRMARYRAASPRPRGT